jgi:hypothetical protein
MQNVHYTIVLLSYALFGVLVLSSVLAIEAAFITGYVRMFSYGW